VERVFAAGADIKEMATLGPREALARAARLQETFDAVAAIPQPVIAAITGFALGGGLELALCADFRICARNARPGQPEIQLGVIPGGGGTQRLTRLIGPARAKHIIFTGRFVDADEARLYGLVDEVVADDVYDAAVRLASSFVEGPAQPNTPSTAAPMPAWQLASNLNGCTSPPCSLPRTRRPACAASFPTVPATRDSSADDGVVTT
jgi:enoyl-CoA hydratase/carnithine racemase